MRERFRFLILFLALVLTGMGFSYPKKSPDITFSDLDGHRYRLSDFRGKVVVLNFFKSDCPPCMVELRELARLYRKYKKDGLMIVSLMVDEEALPLLPRIVEAKKITYPVGLATEETMEAFGGVYITPTTFIIDRQGEVVKRLLGYAGEEYLEKKIREYLGL
ncbi:MAG: hypothetical protein DSZ24_03075 [Thermodesulfatator sp.]|nr:MAG: hypothetical protein DSZ24_03075 [Thermodesulfatator sp.]